MRRSLLPLLLLALTLAGCGGDGAKAAVKIGIDKEAVVTFYGNRKNPYVVTITNEGPAPVQVLWSNRMLDETLAPGSDSSQRVQGDSTNRITCKAPGGATVRLASPGATGVHVLGTPADGK